MSRFAQSVLLMLVLGVLGVAQLGCGGGPYNYGSFTEDFTFAPAGSPLVRDSLFAERTVHAKWFEPCPTLIEYWRSVDDARSELMEDPSSARGRILTGLLVAAVAWGARESCIHEDKTQLTVSEGDAGQVVFVGTASPYAGLRVVAGRLGKDGIEVGVVEDRRVTFRLGEVLGTARDLYVDSVSKPVPVRVVIFDPGPRRCWSEGPERTLECENGTVWDAGTDLITNAVYAVFSMTAP
jgi:hypothetical protein